SAATAVISRGSDTTLYVLGCGSQVDPASVLAFSGVQHLNLNVRLLTDYDFLADFAQLRSLFIQSSTSRRISLKLLSGSRTLQRLHIPANIKDVDFLSSLSELEHVACTANTALLAALTELPRLAFLNIHFGSDRDLRSIAEMPALRGLTIYHVRGLGGDDLEPLAQAANLQALSLGALKNVTHLAALRGRPRDTLTAVLLGGMRGLTRLTDIGTLRALQKLGMYDSRPLDRKLTPLKDLASLTDLIVGDSYPKSEIDTLLSWYSGSLWCRGVHRGEPSPRWRTPIENLA
ncbi:MAG: hypothetical protein ABI181_10055, partial [Mycobacteriaceae bacterium]